MDIFYLREISKRTLLRLCAKRLRKEIRYEDYLLEHMRDLDYCISCKNPIFYKITTNVFENTRRVLIRDIYNVRCEIMKEFQKLIAPSLEDYINVCCGEVLIENISYQNLMFELICLKMKKIDGYKIERKDWWELMMSVISYRVNDTC